MKYTTFITLPGLIALLMSWSVNHSVWWAILHCIIWVGYIPYWLIKYSTLMDWISKEFVK